MTQSYKFWISLAAFQIVFGLTVFAITRQYYVENPTIADARPAITNEAFSTRPDNITEADLAIFDLVVPSQTTTDDPVEISRLANEYFASGQYEQAAVLYEKLLTFDSGSADTYNNLGLTLHYLGRSGEALERLNAGAAVDPTHQRIWLTLGFVNSQAGNSESARTALTNAMEFGSDEGIRKSAAEMLENLP